MTYRAHAFSKTILLREVEEGDAEFIYSLRTNRKLAKYLSPVSDCLNDQVEFIRKYQLNKKDFYFIICSRDWRPLGTVRLYNMTETTFTWGSWVVSQEAPLSSAVETALLIYDYGFYVLRKKKACFDVRKSNEKVIRFHERFGATRVLEDNDNIYFELEKEKYSELRQRYKKFTG